MAKLSPIEQVLLFYGTRFPNHPAKWRFHSILRRRLGVAIDRDIEVVREGLHWWLNPSDYVHEEVFWIGQMDRWDVYHLLSRLGPSGVFYDIGANFGYYSVKVAAALNGNGRIHAFEPNPPTYERLCRHFVMNKVEGVAQAYPIALSDKPGCANLIERADNSGAAHLGNDSEGVTVQVTTLDEVCSRQKEDRIDAIKIDVEGYEARVLEGARATLTRFKPMIVVEFWSTGLVRAKSSVDEVAQILGSLGYKLYQTKRHRLEPVCELPRGDDPINLFAFHSDRSILR